MSERTPTGKILIFTSEFFFLLRKYFVYLKFFLSFYIVEEVRKKVGFKVYSWEGIT